MRISDWSSDVCSSDLFQRSERRADRQGLPRHLDRGSVPVGAHGLAVVDDVRPRLLRGRDDPRQHAALRPRAVRRRARSEEHTSELQSLMRISYAVFCLKKKNRISYHTTVVLTIN